MAWLPLFLFPVLFGLSIDYHVFIVSRIRELHDRGASTSDAVSRGIRATAGTVTAAAAVMVAVFAIFASLPTLDIKQLGVGLAVAVLIDATLIRSVLLPATMKLLGEWNWYLPRWLGMAAPHEPRAPPASWRCRAGVMAVPVRPWLGSARWPCRSIPARKPPGRGARADAWLGAAGRAFAIQLWASTLILTVSW